jgi:putative inorganic carbon (hco3(-)) transporter
VSQRLDPTLVQDVLGPWVILPAVVLAALVGALAGASPPLALAAALGLVFVIATIKSLAAGVTFFTLLIFLERIPQLSSSVTLAKMAGAVLVLGWLLHLTRENGRAPLLFRSHPFLAYAAFLFLTWTFASVLWAADEGRALYTTFQVSQVLLLLLIVFTAVSEQRHLRWIVCAFIAGGVLSALVGLSGATAPEDFGATGASRRLTGGIGDPNALAAVLVPALVLSLFAQAATRSPLVRWLLLSTTTVLALGIFMTQSRGGLVASGVALLATLLLSGPVRARAITGGLIVAAAAVSYFTLVAPPEALSRISDFGTGSGRTNLWAVALEAFENNQVTGVGAGNFTVVEQIFLPDVNLERTSHVINNAVVHNTYLHVLSELGAVGLVLFGAILLGSLIIAWRAVRALARTGDRETEILGRGLMIGTIGMLAAFFFLSAQHEKQLPLMLGTLTALSTLATRRGAPRDRNVFGGSEPPDLGAPVPRGISSTPIPAQELPRSP